MTRDVAAETEREDRLNEVLLAYVEEIESGRVPDRQKLLADNPDLREDLESFFNDRDAIDRLAAPLRVTAEQVDNPDRTSLTSQLDRHFIRGVIEEGRRDGDGGLGQLGDF